MKETLLRSNIANIAHICSAVQLKVTSNISNTRSVNYENHRRITQWLAREKIVAGYPIRLGCPLTAGDKRITKSTAKTTIKPL